MRSLRAHAPVALMGVFGALAVWTGWGWPSAPLVAWVAFVGAGLLIATALAVRSGGPTRSVAQILYEPEHQVGDAPGDVPQGASSAGLR